MNLRDLMNKLDAINNGILDEGFNYKAVQQQVGAITNPDERHQAVAQIAVTNNLPGLYDPVDGKYVSNQNQVSSSADKDTDYMLASKGLIPPNAQTSTFFGRMTGYSGDKYDQGLRGQSNQFVSDQEAAEFKQKKFAELQDIMQQLSALKKIEAPKADSGKPAAAAAPTTAPAANAAPGSAGTPTAAPGQGSTPAQAPAAAPVKPASVTQNKDGTFLLKKKDGTNLHIDAEGKILKEWKTTGIADDLMESFGYTNEDAVDNTLAGTQIAGGAAEAGLAKMGMKGASKMASKAVPLAGTLLSAKDAYERWQKGDRTGAVISTLAGAGWLVPGPWGWVLGGAFDAMNFGRDLAGSNQPAPQQGPTPAQPQAPTAGKGDPKIVALQKYLVSQNATNIDGTPLKIDGIMGKNTRAAMDKVGLQESQKMAIWRILTDSYDYQLDEEGGVIAALKGLFKAGKGASKEAVELAKDIPVGTIVKDSEGANWKWLGGRWEKETAAGSGQFNMKAGVATPGAGKTAAVAGDLEAAYRAEADAAKKSGTLAQWIKDNPMKAKAIGITAAIAAGGGAGYMMGKDGGQGPTPEPAPGPTTGPKPTPKPKEEEAKLICSPEQMELIKKAAGVMKELEPAAKSDPAVAQVIKSYQKQIDDLDCSSGQGATPKDTRTPLERWQDRY
jgi:hypothetical protein